MMHTGGDGVRSEKLWHKTRTQPQVPPSKDFEQNPKDTPAEARVIKL
jgi:hypothetical protein